MTEEEKKEFEEFLQWKAEKAKKEAIEKESSSNSGEATEEKQDESPKDDLQLEPSPKQETDNTVLVVFVAIIAILFLFFMLYTCSNVHKKADSPEEDYVEVVDSVVVGEVEPNPETYKKEWDFTIKKDEMTDTKNIWATIQSDDYIIQEFPYGGNTYATITVRYMKKYGYDVLIYITKGQINGSDYYGTDFITARFDDGSPKKYRFDEAADGSSDHVFLRNSSDFISRCKKAKDIKIDIPVYQAGRPVFSFHVDEPLVWREE